MMAARDAAILERDRALLKCESLAASCASMMRERDAAVAARQEIFDNEYVKMVFGCHPTHALIADKEPTGLLETCSVDEFVSWNNAKLKMPGGKTVEAPAPFESTGKHGDFFIKNILPWTPISPGEITFPDQVLYRKSSITLSNVRRAEGLLFDKKGIYYPDEVTRGFDYVVLGDENNIVFHRKFALVKFSDWRTIDGLSLIYFDINSANYYHWLIDSLLRLYLMREVVGLSGNVFFPGREEAMTEWQRASLSIFSEDIKFFPTDGEIFNLEAAAWSGKMGVTECPSPLLCDFAKFIKKKVVNRVSRKVAQPRRLYVSRQGKRGVLNDEEVASVLSGYGFMPIRPETMTFDEQVSVFSEADVIVGAHGAGLSNIIFCSGQAAIIELFPWSEWRPFFWAICNRFGFRYTYLRCRSPADPSIYAPGDMPFTVCIDELRTAIEEALRLPA